MTRDSKYTCSCATQLFADKIKEKDVLVTRVKINTNLYVFTALRCFYEAIILRLKIILINL